ncbi:unnamed protein product, partial [Mesorhabditis belari]|uniref:Uncharacterized protein n=1 Tax=Mesorhabditis belari TaxID=2138241 RepID=A0AAF3FLM8_9BILA
MVSSRVAAKETSHQRTITRPGDSNGTFVSSLHERCGGYPPDSECSDVKEFLSILDTRCIEIVSRFSVSVVRSCDHCEASCDLCCTFPVIYAILRLRLTKNPCYQIMLTIVFADMLNLLANSLFAGYLMLIGAVFCMDPLFMYIEGAFNMCAWAFASFLYVVLALNRFIVIAGSDTIAQNVVRIPIHFWLFLAVTWSVYTGILHKPLTYNSRAFLAYYNPFIEEHVIELEKYENRMHALNNVIFSILICFFYSMISLILLCGKRPKKFSARERNALIQAFFITCPAMLGSILYVYIQFTNKATQGWAILGQFMWQTITGTGAIIYLTLNSSVRDFLFYSATPSQAAGNDSRTKQNSGMSKSKEEIQNSGMIVFN